MNNYITKNKKWISFTAFCQICTSTTTTAIKKYNLQLIEYYLKKRTIHLPIIHKNNDIEKR